MNDNAIFDLKCYGIIKISGQDAFSFLQGQLSVDVRTVQKQGYSFGAYCSAKGRVQAFFRLWIYQGDYYLRLPNSLVSRIVQELLKYARFSKVTVKDISDEVTMFGIMGQNVVNSLEIYFPTQTFCSIIPTPGKTPRFEVYGDSKIMRSILKEVSAYFRLGSQNEWILEDIRAFIPEVFPETFEHFLPHSLNLPSLGAVSFVKGCFRGQEVVARMEHLGNLKRCLCYGYAKAENYVLVPGTFLTSEKATSERNGEIVYGSPSPKGGIELLVEINPSLIKENPLYLDLQKTIPVEILCNIH